MMRLRIVFNSLTPRKRIFRYYYYYHHHYQAMLIEESKGKILGVKDK